jgi:5-methylcytosine-specific restriction protein A
VSPPKLCAEPGCPNASENARCPKHTVEVERGYRRRSARSRKVYQSPRWRGLRLWKLRENPFCQCSNRKCKHHSGLERCMRVAHEVDHVVPIEQAPERAFDPLNLQSLCSSCHSTKTMEETHQKQRS